MSSVVKERKKKKNVENGWFKLIVFTWEEKTGLCGQPPEADAPGRCRSFTGVTSLSPHIDPTRQPCPHPYFTTGKLRGKVGRWHSWGHTYIKETELNSGILTPGLHSLIIPTRIFCPHTLSISQSLTDGQGPAWYIMVTVVDPFGPNFCFPGKAQEAPV